ncbi:hypothetical protein EUGRSUZ_A00333 [Eucalyptus grandis]|uniref:Uncharacterized protein n=2 Tax=Eucalyptus grandis TaxID=71139 RepID=A0ACC3LZR6_EUCGR|nr:hypothetical protein EUGRSUZ_A00333 [Eucalyptus grandis]
MVLARVGVGRCWHKATSKAARSMGPSSVNPAKFGGSRVNNNIGEEYGPWVPFIGTMFLFIFVSNWSRALLPWKIIELPHGKLAAPTNDINTTAALTLLTSVAYFYASLTKKGLSYFSKYIQTNSNPFTH